MLLREIRKKIKNFKIIHRIFSMDIIQLEMFELSSLVYTTLEMWKIGRIDKNKSFQGPEFFTNHFPASLYFAGYQGSN